MRLSTLLLSSAALVASGTVGLAADLPSKKAAPVEYVRVCSQFGAGFFYIPGSDTCMRVSGRVRAEYYANEVFARSGNATAMRARGYLALDSYTATDWGPVRATTRVFVTRDSGRGSASNSSATTDGNVTLDWAYIQFAGITAGRLATSFFEFAPFGGISYAGGGTHGRGADRGSINALAYTASFGGGFSATLALEDGTERRVGIGNAPARWLETGSATIPVGDFGGHVMPDVVARLEYSGSWGIAALTGAVHQTRALAVYGTPAAVGDTEYGFAVQGGLKINLPMLAAGDAIFLQAAYADGANSYTGWNNTTAGSVELKTADVIYDVNGNGRTTKSWSVTGGLLHFWTPTVRQGVYAAYGSVDHWGKWFDSSAVSVGTNLIWSPVRGLDIGGEVGYTKWTDIGKGVYLDPKLTAGLAKDNFFGRIRFQRDF